MMRLRAKNEVYTSSGIDVTRFNNDECIKQYDSLMSKLLHDCNTWRLIALSALVLFLASLIVLTIAMNQPETELVVIGVNDIGQTKYYGKARGISYEGYNNKDDICKNIITMFIKATYQITTDAQLMYQDFTDVMYYLQSDKRRAYEAEINAKDPFSDVGRIKRYSEIESIVPITGSSYQVEWKTYISDMKGYDVETYRYRGTVSLTKMSAAQYQKLSEEIRVKNPMGIYITDFNFVELKDAE